MGGWHEIGSSGESGPRRGQVVKDTQEPLMRLFDRTLRARVILFTGVVAAAMLVANGANLLSTRSLSRASGAAAM